jgi:signal transduction histidine kinase
MSSDASGEPTPEPQEELRTNAKLLALIYDNTSDPVYLARALARAAEPAHADPQWRGDPQARTARGPASRASARDHRTTAQHLARIVDDLLDLTRISQGKIRLQRRRLDLVEIVSQTAEDHRSLLESHALTVELPDHAVWIDGDPTRLVQIVGNLITNATKITPHGQRISVTLAEAEQRAVIEVSDTLRDLLTLGGHDVAVAHTGTEELLTAFDADRRSR